MPESGCSVTLYVLHITHPGNTFDTVGRALPLPSTVFGYGDLHRFGAVIDSTTRW